MYVLIGILLLGILVAVHEFGHFMAARMTGIAVQEFAIGMGPKIIGWTSRKTGTKFSLRIVPFGGFCAFYGEDDVSGKFEADPRDFARQAVWKRMLTVLMGPVMNFVLALVVAVVYCWSAGAPVAYPFIMTVNETAPAYAGGLRPGDAVIAINGVDVGVEAEEILDPDIMSRFEGFSNLISASEPGEEMVLTVLRVVGEGETAELTVLDVKGSTYWDESLGRAMMGIEYSMCFPDPDHRRPVGFLGGVEHGWNMCATSGTAVFDALGKLFTDKEMLQQVGGPVEIVKQVSQSVEVGGIGAFISMLVMISVNLGIMNLLPIPGLDGSRFLFMGVEAVRGKPIKREREAMIHLIGMVFLFGIIILVTIKDVASCIP